MWEILLLLKHDRLLANQHPDYYITCVTIFIQEY